MTLATMGDTVSPVSFRTLEKHCTATKGASPHSMTAM